MVELLAVVSLGYAVVMTVLYVRLVRDVDVRMQRQHDLFADDQRRVERVWRDRLGDLREQYEQKLSFVRAGIEDKNDLPSTMFMDKGRPRFRSRWMSPADEASYARQIMSGQRVKFEPGDK